MEVAATTAAATTAAAAADGKITPRSEQWWESTAHHHRDSRAAVHSLLFIGDKHAERGHHGRACESYAGALEMSSSSIRRPENGRAKALGTIGWHLLLGRTCSPSAREKLSRSFDDPVEGGASRNLAERVLLAAAEAEVDVNAMALVWRALGWVARAKSWLSFQTDGAT